LYILHRHPWFPRYLSRIPRKGASGCVTVPTFSWSTVLAKFISLP
jgi:hypothetical protein